MSFVPDTYPLWHTMRLDVAPGITGLWQVCERGNPDADQRLKLDIAYIERQSLWLDLHIIARTIGQLFARRP
jgi:lipopolysaccharide/colanic/teichoic acid biosynthesis glycosyltransferase